MSFGHVSICSYFFPHKIGNGRIWHTYTSHRKRKLAASVGCCGFALEGVCAPKSRLWVHSAQLPAFATCIAALRPWRAGHCLPALSAAMQFLCTPATMGECWGFFFWLQMREVEDRGWMRVTGSSFVHHRPSLFLYISLSFFICLIHARAIGNNPQRNPLYNSGHVTTSYF